MKARAWLLVPFLVYVGCVALLGDWIIDDAGISFAYARNVATGHGFVSQPGRVPVEGFSNFLWVLTVVPLFWLRLFDPIWAPKVLGALLVLSTLFVIERTLSKATGRRWPGVLAVSLVATAPPIVIWSASGMENALLLLLVASLWAVAALRVPRWELAGGVLSGLAAMTRPEALVFALAMPLVSLVELAARRATPKQTLVESARALGAFAALALPFFAFRSWRFGMPLPHTYYAKLEFGSQGERLGALFANGAASLREKIFGLGEAFAGPVGVWLFSVSLVALVVVVRRRLLSRAAGAALVLLGLSSFAFVWLPNDWMGEFRFATPVVVLAWVYLFALAPAVLEILPVWAKRRALVLGASGAVLSAVLASAAVRLVRFAENPPTPYASVERQFARRFDAYARSLGAARASILIADAGAPLFASRLTVYDVAGLTEPAVQRTLRKGGHVWYYDHPQFYDWVFDEIRPTFVVTHAFWSNVTTLGLDPRFARDYVPIDSFPDAYVKAAFGRDVRSGEFVRRDALRTPDAFDRMRRSYVFPPLAEPPVLRIGDRLRAWLRGRPPNAEELVREAELALSSAKPNPARAAALYRRALVGDRRNLVARERLALALDQAGRSGEAHDEWERALGEAAAKNDQALLDRARARLGDQTLPAPARNDGPGQLAYARRLLASGRVAEARGALDRALASNPRSADAYFLLGVAAAAEKRQADALVAYARAVSLDPGHADALNNLGFTLALLGRFSEAVAPLEQAVRLRPEAPLPRANLAWANSELAKLAKPAQ